MVVSPPLAWMRRPEESANIGIFPLALMLLGATLLFQRPAYAYADPGTGLLAIQAVGSALVAGGWYLRRRIYALFHRGSAVKREPEALPTAKDRGSSTLQ
jgi:hypothetical protein